MKHMKLLASSTTSENRNLWHILCLYIYWIYWYLRHHCIMCFKLINFWWSFSQHQQTSAYRGCCATRPNPWRLSTPRSTGSSTAVQRVPRSIGCWLGRRWRHHATDLTRWELGPLRWEKLRKTRHTIKTLKTLTIYMYIISIYIYI